MLLYARSMGRVATRRRIVALQVLALAGCGGRTSPLADDGGPIDEADGGSEPDAGGEGEGEGCWQLDLGPDARPSDYPEADEWVDTDPSGLGDSEPCCELVGGAVEITDGQHGGGSPNVAWDGDGWGVLWADQGWLTFRTLDAFAAAGGPPIRIGDRAGVTSVSLEWAGCFALAGSGFRATPGSVGVMDEDGALLAGITYLPGEAHGRDIARYAHGRGWIEVHRFRRDDQSVYEALWVDDAAAASAPLEIAVAGEDAGGEPHVVGSRSLATFVWPSSGGVWARSVAWPDVAGARPAWRVVEPATSDHAIVAAAAYRDAVAIASHDGTVQVALFDPWTDQLLAGPTVLGNDAYADVSGAGIASAQERGFLGLCYPTAEGEPGLAFVLVGPDARPWGEPVTFPTDWGSTESCAVAWSGREFLVTWYRPGGDNGLGRVFAQRVLPRV